MTACDRCGARAATEVKQATGNAILSLCQHHTDKFGAELHKQGYELVQYGRIGEPV